MKELFDKVSENCSKEVTQSYSTSFSLATKMLSKSIRQDIYNIYGFVRFADEIVDTFHDYDKESLLKKFKEDLYIAIEDKISLNPILNSFQKTVHKYDIPTQLIDSFLKSMELDLKKSKYLNEEEYKEYIYGSADVVGLMCLKIFVNGDQKAYDKLKDSAMSLGSAFQKVNFLRDLKADFEDLGRTYFPNINFKNMSDSDKELIIADIEKDFNHAYEGILLLPNEAKFGVFMAYRYYKRLLKKLKQTPAIDIKNARIRVPDSEKITLLTRSYLKYKLKMVK